MKTGIEIIEEERKRQVEEEGWTAKHDDKHTDGELAEAAAVYAAYAKSIDMPIEDEQLYFTSANEPGFKIEQRMPDGTRVLVDKAHRWPFSPQWYKPTPENRVRELAKAGALIAAEIDRLQRKKL